MIHFSYQDGQEEWTYFPAKDVKKRGAIAMIQVIQRDGEITDFTLTKISDAIMRAFLATDRRDGHDEADLLALRVTADFQERITEEGILASDIQNSVQRVLLQAGYEEAARAYIGG